MLSFVRDESHAFALALAARPREEPPFTAIGNAYRDMLHRMESTLRVFQMIDATPSLKAAHMRYMHEHGEELIQVLGDREGVDPATDRRPGLSRQQGLAHR